MEGLLRGWGGGDVMPYRDLSFSHDAVCALSILFVLLGLVVALLVAEQPQGLRALQVNLKLLRGREKNKRTFGCRKGAKKNIHLGLSRY